MKLLTMLSLMAALSCSGVAQATTIKTAAACGEAVLQSYEQRRFPENLIDVPAIITRAVGADMHRLSQNEIATVFAVAYQILKQSFTQPDDDYQFNNIEVTLVEKTRRGYRATGTVHIRSSMYTGTENFMVLNNGDGCFIYQVRIADWSSLDAALRGKLKQHVATRKFLD